MSIETNKLVMHRFTEFINTASEKLAAEPISPEAIFHVPGRSEPMRGLGGYFAINRQANRGASDELLHSIGRPIRGRTRAARFAGFTAANWRGSEMSEMRYRTLTVALAVVFSVAPSRAQTKTVTLPLDSAEGLKSVNAKVEPVTYKGRKAIRVTDTAPQGTSDDGRFVVVAGSQFEDGLIEVDVAGDRFPAATEVARGFVGVAFRVAQDGPPFEAFYLRPYNGRSDDQLQRNHSAQYISSPEYPWNRLRQEFPGKYETYVDLVPSEWTKMKIEVKGDKARLYVNGAPEPTLIVNHLLHGSTKGAVALFISLGSVAHFSNLRVSK